MIVETIDINGKMIIFKLPPQASLAYVSTGFITNWKVSSTLKLFFLQTYAKFSVWETKPFLAFLIRFVLPDSMNVKH